MNKILHFLNEYLEETICVILMSVMTIIIFIQVVMRYLMHNSLSWSEELPSSSWMTRICWLRKYSRC